MKKILLFALALVGWYCATGQTLEKSQSIMIYDTPRTLPPSQYGSERMFVRSDSTEYRWDGFDWVPWYDGEGCITDLQQGSILVRTCLGTEVDRDTVRVPVSGEAGDGIYGRDDTIPDNRVVLIEDQFDMRRLENGGVAGYNEFKFNDSGMRIGGYGNGSSIDLFGGNASTPGRVFFNSSRFNFSTLNGGPNIFTLGDSVAAFPQYPDADFLGTSNVGQLIARSFSDVISTDASNALVVGTDNKLFVSSAGDSSSSVSADSVTIDGLLYEVAPSSNLQDFADQVDRALLLARSTGIRTGGQASVDGGPGASANVSFLAGQGQILDNSDPADQMYKSVSWSAQNGIALANTGTVLTYWYVDSLGTINQQTTTPNGSERRTRIYLAVTAYTSSIAAISGIVATVTPTQHTPASVYDISAALGPIKQSGLQISNAGAGLTWRVTSGLLFDYGTGWNESELNPHNIPYSEFNTTSGGTFRNVTTAGIIAANETEIDVANYQSGGVVTAIPGNVVQDRFGKHYVFVFPGTTPNYRVVYGGDFYTTTEDAAASLSYDDAVSLATQGFREFGILLGAIIAEKDETDNANFVFVNTNKFGLFGGALVSAAQGDAVQTVVAGTGISVDDTDPANPIVTNTAPNVVQDAEDTAIDAIASLPASTNVQEGLSELATNYSALDQVVNALRILSGMPLLSENFGTFTGTLFPDNQTAKPLYQLIETELQAHLDSITALRGDIGTGGSTEIADGTTITGDGTVGDPFTVDSDLVNKQGGSYRIWNDSSTIETKENVFESAGLGARVLNTGVKLVDGNKVVRMYMDFDRDSGAASQKQLASLKIIFRTNSGADGITNLDAQVEGDWLLSYKIRAIIDNNGYVNFALGEVTDSPPTIVVRLREITVASGVVDYVEGQMSLNATTDISSYPATATTIKNISVVPGLETRYSKDGYYTAATFVNTANETSATGVVIRLLPGREETNGVGPEQDKGAYIGAEKGTDQNYHIVIGTPSNRSNTATERMRIANSGDVGIATTTPTYQLDIGGTGAIRLPRGTTAQRPVGTAGLLRFNSTWGGYDGHNGTSFTRFVSATDTDASDGNFLSYNSAVDLYEPVTLTGGIGIDITSIGTDRGFALDLGELTAVATLSGNEFIANYDVTDGNQLTHIDTVANYIKNSIELTETDFSQNSNVSISADLPINHLTLEITSSSVENSTATLPTASSTYEGHIVKIWSIDTSGSFDNEVTATTIQNGAFTGSTINLNNFQATEISCIRTSVSNYRWVVTNQY